MSHLIPAEYLTPEERRLTIAELETRIRRAWITFVLVDAIALVVAVLIVFALMDSAPETVVIAIAVVPYSLFVVYWIVLRIQPWQRRLAALRESQTADSES